MFRNFKISIFTLTILVSSYFALVINFPFLLESGKFFLAEKNSLLKTIGLLINLGIFLFSIFIFLLSLAPRYTEKLVFIILVLIGSLLSYAYFYYGLSIDSHATILAAIEQTNITRIATVYCSIFNNMVLVIWWNTRVFSL